MTMRYYHRFSYTVHGIILVQISVVYECGVTIVCVVWCVPLALYGGWTDCGHNKKI